MHTYADIYMKRKNAIRNMCNRNNNNNIFQVYIQMQFYLSTIPAC